MDKKIIEDFEINTHISNIQKVCNKILESNKKLKSKNNKLEKEIKALNSNIDILISNNQRLSKLLEEVSKEEYILKRYKEIKDTKAVDTEVENLSMFEKTSLEEYKKRLLSMDKNQIENLAKLIGEILKLEHLTIEDDFGVYITSLVDYILENNKGKISRENLLGILKLLYKNIDEDLLIEFTDMNQLKILELIRSIEDKNISYKYIDIIIKIGRILYSEERLLEADNFLGIFDLEFLSRNIKDESTVIDLLLIHNHILKFTNRGYIKLFWEPIWNKNYNECNDMLNYLRSLELLSRGFPEEATKQVIILSNRQKEIEEIEGEVCGDIKRISYNFMVKELKNKIKNTEIKNVDNMGKEKIKKNKDLQKEYLDHRLYLIKDDENICPFDNGELDNEIIVEKGYINKKDLKENNNPEYIELESLHCRKCNNYFLRAESLSNINLELDSIPITEIKIESEEGEFELRDKSPLRESGYHTGLSELERWNILTNKCIPEIGVNRVLYYLKSFVGRFSRQDKDYSNSIGKWKKDIRKVERKYK